MTPAEEVAETALTLAFADATLKEACVKEETALKRLGDGLRKAEERFKPACDHANEAANRANDVYLDAKETYDAAFKAAKRENNDRKST